MLVMLLFAVFLILLVLVQRGRGGGLAGALGGAGGSSAFGAKAGDAFTRFTIVAASLWIILCVGAAIWSREGVTDPLGAGDDAVQVDTIPGVAGDTPDEGAGAAVGDDSTSGEAAGGEEDAESE